MQVQNYQELKFSTLNIFYKQFKLKTRLYIRNTEIFLM